MIDFILRGIEPTDVSFICSSWLKSNKRTVPYKNIRNSVYFANHQQIIFNILKSSDIVVACNPDNTSQVFGWSVGQVSSNGNKYIHFVYVKFALRRLGIGKALAAPFLTPVGKNPTIVTATSHLLRTFADKYGIIYNPYALGTFYDKEN